MWPGSTELDRRCGRGPTPATLKRGTAGRRHHRLGDAIRVTARGNVQVAEIFNPTLLAQGIFNRSPPLPLFLDLWRDSSANLTAVGGSVTLDDESLPSERDLELISLANGVQPFPPAAGACSTRCRPRSICGAQRQRQYSRSLVTSPSSSGNLQVLRIRTSRLQCRRADRPGRGSARPSSAGSPVNQNGLGIYSDIEGALSLTLPDQHAAVPLRRRRCSGPLQPCASLR